MMSMKKEIIDVDKINNEFLRNLNITNAILYYFDKVEAVKNIKNINFTNLIEARLFGLKNEIRIMRQECELKAVLFQEEESDEFIESQHLVIDKRFDDVKYIKIKKYIENDDDGQAYISCFRPYELA